MANSLHLKTPLFQSHRLMSEYQADVWYKMECHQPSGSFKIRGMEHLCKHHISKGHQNFIASSGGNAGYSLAYVGKKLGARVTVVVPETTAPYMFKKIKQLDAKVIIHGAVWDEAESYALDLCKQEEGVYVSPFDDHLLWEGHASMIDECTTEMGQPDKIVLSVGGGGLLCGVLTGLKRNGWQNTKVITIETEGAASFKSSIDAGKLVTLDGINSIATSLGAKTVSKKSLELAADFDLTALAVTDQIALQSVATFLDEYNVLVEPACGAALSYPYFMTDQIQTKEKVLVIACGGVSLGWEYFKQLEKQFR